VLERRAPPTFDILIEIQDRQRLAIHRNVAASVDSMLRGNPLGLEIRYRDENGEVQVEMQEAWKVPSPEFARRRDGREQRNGTERVQTRQVRGNPARRRAIEANSVQPSESTRKTSIYAYGVARNRLLQAAKSLNVSIEIVKDLGQADIMVTLKSYFRRQRKLIVEAQNRRIPVYVLRANTITQMENFLVEALNLDVTPNDPFEQAIAETETAIQKVQSGQSSVDLAPVSSAIRRYQHQMARQANLVSHSYGKGANRHVRIFSTPRNQEAAY
ncbi:MAG: R3H domain-containing nucleic acid-binding protein, partial [Chloroflexota bacterium]